MTNGACRLKHINGRIGSVDTAKVAEPTLRHNEMLSTFNTLSLRLVCRHSGPSAARQKASYKGCAGIELLRVKASE